MRRNLKAANEGDTPTSGCALLFALAVLLFVAGGTFLALGGSARGAEPSSYTVTLLASSCGTSGPLYSPAQTAPVTLTDPAGVAFVNQDGCRRCIRLAQQPAVGVCVEPGGTGRLALPGPGSYTWTDVAAQQQQRPDAYGRVVVEAAPTPPPPSPTAPAASDPQPTAPPASAPAAAPLAPAQQPAANPAPSAASKPAEATPAAPSPTASPTDTPVAVDALPASDRNAAATGGSSVLLFAVVAGTVSGLVVGAVGLARRRAARG